MTIVIMVLLTLIGVGMYSSKGISEWKLGRTAGETLRTVATAKRMFLADNPVASVESITEAQIIDYLPNQKTPKPTTLKLALPELKSLTGHVLGFRVNDPDSQKPLVYLIDSGGVHYDPSGSTTDSLWDIGQ
jgi:hypothetical protein